jgi:site-specific DNA-methyltransferase (adenine-specific)
LNYLYLGDCLDVLRNEIKAESIDLIYIDPPFNSKRDYNLFFDDKEIKTQRIAFEDTWTLKNIQDSLTELHTIQTETIYKLLITYQEVAPHAFPYLVMMALRIIELHRVLKSTGSFYLHCDPTMSHYLKTVCDIIFEKDNFRNEIIWKRAQPKSHVTVRFSNSHDVILFYGKSPKAKFKMQYTPHDEEYLENFYKYEDSETGRKYRLGDLTNPNKNRPNLTYEFPPGSGVTRVWRWTKERMTKAWEEGRVIQPKNGGVVCFKRYLDEMEGSPVTDLWDDIEHLHSQSESLGYPTQKPKALLERIIKTGSEENDTVLDAFCGCGTTIDAAEGNKRQWIGIDISPVAISLIKRRLEKTYSKSLSKYEIRGTPIDEYSAMKLWEDNPNAFQDWWCTELEVFSTSYGTKGADKGLDGIGLYQVGKESDDTLKIGFQVKGGKVQSKDIDALIGAMKKQNCEAGIFLTIEEPTKPMLETIASMGFVKKGFFEIPKLQIMTLKDYFKNKKLKLPPENITFKAAKKIPKKGTEKQIL